jgi:hypothetical protein
MRALSPVRHRCERHVLTLETLATLVEKDLPAE